VICDNALVGGFAAGARPVGARIVRDVCDEFDLGTASAAAAGAAPPAPAAPAAPKAGTPEAAGPMFDAVNRRRRFSFF
jgi:hypothetical protein